MQRYDHVSPNKLKRNENQEDIQGNDCHNVIDGKTVHRSFQEPGGHEKVHDTHLAAMDTDFFRPGQQPPVTDFAFRRNRPPLWIPHKTGYTRDTVGPPDDHTENVRVPHGAFDNLVNLLGVKVPQREGKAAGKLGRDDRKMIFQVTGPLAPFPIVIRTTESGQNNGHNRYQR
ncbi:hypothetical protein [Pelobacter propionicus]|uniref:hypothetical protein n=1 Tax=Pelobacter propionicus TaxID=29543 RepID=UPI0018DD38E2|nr:hypothetical protein [Pelobacter propionicus]